MKGIYKIKYHTKIRDEKIVVGVTRQEAILYSLGKDEFIDTVELAPLPDDFEPNGELILALPPKQIKFIKGTFKRLIYKWKETSLVGGAISYEMTKESELVETEGRLFDQFAVTKPDGGWSVFHVPSGLRICQTNTEKLAKCIAWMLSQLPIDWSFTDASQIDKAKYFETIWPIKEALRDEVTFS